MTWDLFKLLPQRPPMLLLDQILEDSAEKMVAQVCIRENSLGFENGAVPAWFGVEYMAQTIAAYNAIHFSTSLRPEIGFLVGLRGFESQVTEFPKDSHLEIVVLPTMIVESSGSFQCEIHLNKTKICQALLTTYKPSSEVLEKMKEEFHG